MSIYIYHERQPSASALCGVHALNTLLQRPAYSEIDLANTARELDRQERMIFEAEGQETPDYLKYAKGGSNNVSDDGNFSIQVLQALLQKRDITCYALTAKNYYSVVCALSQESAFLCNTNSHWFAIRKILPGEWFNFNSLLSTPQHMLDSQLGSFLDDLFDKKDVTIYSIKGNLPPISPENRPKKPDGQWIVASGQNKEDFEFKVAIELSKQAASNENEKKNNSTSNSTYPKLDSENSSGYPKLDSGNASYPKLDQVSYPKLPDSTAQISYPKVEEKQKPAIQPISVNTQDLSIPEHIRVLNDYFGRLVEHMEKMDLRMTNVENAFAKIAQSS
jgi:hypothetical protein